MARAAAPAASRAFERRIARCRAPADQLPSAGWSVKGAPEHNSLKSL